MLMLVTTVIATCAMVIGYGLLGFGGPICALIFLAIVFTGAFLSYAEPLLAKLKP
jgi:hypothetical protein